MRGYRRSQWYDETGIRWVARPPNIRDLQTALRDRGWSAFQRVARP